MHFFFAKIQTKFMKRCTILKLVFSQHNFFFKKCGNVPSSYRVSSVGSLCPKGAIGSVRPLNPSGPMYIGLGGLMTMPPKQPVPNY